MRRLNLLFFGFFVSVLLGHGEAAGAPAAETTRTVSGGGVTATVTYLNATSGDDARFLVVLDTHSVDLDSYDLKSLSRLRDGTGKTYEPTKVETKGSGHHREITVTFPKPRPEAKRLELLIGDIAGVKERTFTWDRQ